MTETTPKAARTRQRLLEAARELLPGALRAGLEHSLGPVPVARRADVSRQTWYRNWGAGDGEFVADLVRHLLPVSRGMAGATRDGVAALVPGQALGIDAARELARLAFFVSAEPEFVLSRFVVFALATEERIVAEREGCEELGDLTAIVRDFFDGYTDELAGAYGVMLEGWGREPAPPFDLHSLAVVLTALAAGLSFRRVVDPEAVPEDLGTAAILMLAPALTRAKAGGPGAGPTELFGDDPDAATEKSSAQRLAGRKRVARSRAAIVAAARREFTVRRYSEVSMAGISAAAGVSATTLYEHFWNKAGVARACFEPEYMELARAVETDPAEPIARIRNHIVRLAEMLGAHPALAIAVLDAFGESDDVGEATDANDPRLVAPLPMPLLRPISEAKAAGMIRSDIRSLDVAIAITNLTLVHGRLNPRASGEEVAMLVERVILNGVMTDAGRAGSTGHADRHPGVG